MIVKAFNDHNKKDERENSDTPQKIKNTIDFHHFCLNKKQQREEALRAFEKSLQEEQQKLEEDKKS
jgi:hypothetical protein